MQLSVPRSLSETETGACRAALAKVLGREPHLEIAVDSGLIAGLELRTPHVIVRDSLRGDLERLKAGLIADDPNHG
jgi:F-type H+-transporting ATPase subunit b